MRAGLLSDPKVIATLNERFVNTWVIIDDIQRRVGAKHPDMARHLLGDHEYPFDFMFFSPEGAFLSRLTSFEDLPGAHPDVGHPRRATDEAHSHTDVFLEALAERFPPH